MKKLLAAALLLLSFQVFASGKIIKVMKNKRSVVVPLSEDITKNQTLIFFDEGKNKAGEGKVYLCKLRSCLVQVSYLSPSKNLEDFRTWKSSTKKNKYYGDINLGTPMGFGIAASFGTKRKNWSLSASLGLIKQKYDSLPAQGFFVSADAYPHRLSFSNWYRTFFQVGYTRLNNQLGEVDSGASDKTLSAFFFTAAPEAYFTHHSWEGFFRLSLSYNTFTSSVTASSGQSINIPYSGFVIAPVIGIRKHF